MALTHVTMLSLSAVLLFGCGPLDCEAAGNAFLAASRVTLKDVEDELQAELTDNGRQRAHKNRVNALEKALKPMYASLPKNPDGALPHAVVRYVLHRIMGKDHGWFVKGLEPDGSGSASLHSLKEWVPTHLQQLLENGSNGMDLRKLAFLVVTLEDLVHKEAVGRMKALYDLHGFPADKSVDVELADRLLDSFSLIYTRGGNWTALTSQEGWARTENFKRNSPQWPRLEVFLRKVRQDVTMKSIELGFKKFDFEELSNVAAQIGARYGNEYFAEDCKSVKAELLGMEDQMPGRVLLSSFYSKSMHARWAFTEKVDYLRVIGALDESDKSKPRVIVANYVLSRPNCMEASGLYAVCCPNECEGLMGHLEQGIKAPTALPKKISGLVAALPSATVQAPRELPASLLGRLDQIASSHGGHVPLHGRLFAQWMHHAFPRECPFPHEAGTTNPQTADEWLAQTGQESTQASEEEMTCHVSGDCAGGSAAAGAAVVSPPSTVSTFATARADAEAAAAEAGIVLPSQDAQGAAVIKSDAASESPTRVTLVELPWSDAEELLIDSSTFELDADLPTIASEEQLASVNALNRLLHTLTLSGIALGLASWAKIPELNLAAPTKVRSPSFWLTMLLFLVPLAVVSADCLVGFGTTLFLGSEYLLCGLCWIAAAVVAAQARHSSPAFCTSSAAAWSKLSV
jgi:hypothetical protein